MSKSANMAAAIAVAVGSTLTIGTFGIAQAEDAASPKTRADVLAELKAARDSGELGALAGEDSGSFFLARRMREPGRPRATVLAETAAARHSGAAAALVGEDSGSSFLVSGVGASTRTRAQVIGEVLFAQASGELGILVGEDSGSEYLRRAMPEHWKRYAGPDIGSDVPEPPQHDQRAG